MDNDQKFRSIVAAILGIAEDQVSEALSSETIETWDSLNHINLIGALEQEFGVTLPAENLGDAMAIPKLRELLTERGVEL